MPVVSTDVKCMCGHSVYVHSEGGCAACDCTIGFSVKRDSKSNVKGDPRYLQLLEEMKTLHINKNAGYAGESTDRWANFRLAETLGVPAVVGVLVRMSDKWIRVTNLIKNPSLDKVGESLKDTLFDLAAYSLIAICLLDEVKHEDN